jgi:hypothetical protein
MKYELIDQYFEPTVFQPTVQQYLDTVFAKLVEQHSMTETKGKFRHLDLFDMPYSVHILNGMIPMLQIYERFLITQKQLKHADTEGWLKVLMLGFTFHDANKLLHLEDKKGKNDLEYAIEELNFEKYQLDAFFPEWRSWRNEIAFLSLATENRTSVFANQFSVRGEQYLRNILQSFCHLADGFASIQELNSVEEAFDVLSKKLKEIENVMGQKMPISFVEIRANPYILLSQNVLQAARKVFSPEKKVFYALRNGFIFFGENATNEELIKIRQAFIELAKNLDPNKLTSVDAQKCEFGFIGSVPFTASVIENVVNNSADSFLLMSPNGKDKIRNFDNFVQFLRDLLDVYETAGYSIEVQPDEKSGRLYLRFGKNIEEETDEADFKKIFALHKIQWLNAKNNKAWQADLDTWTGADNKKQENSKKPVVIDLDKTDNFNSALLQPIGDLKTVADVVKFIEDCTNSSAGILKTVLNIIKTNQVLSEKRTPQYIAELEANIIAAFDKPAEFVVREGMLNDFVARYFYAYGHEDWSYLTDNYEPIIPHKSKMCAFTGGLATKPYTEGVAFGMKARGFTNRTVTSLANTQSFISELYAEENKLRKTHFSDASDANLIVYNDFFETNLDINPDIIRSTAKVRNLNWLDKATIEFDKNAKFELNLFNLTFTRIDFKIEPIFYFVRRALLLVKKLGIRSFVTGIMSPYQPHKAVFHFEQAPTFLKQMGWHQVRLLEVEGVLLEMTLLLLYNPKMLESNLLKVAKDRRSYFQLFDKLKDEDKTKVRPRLEKFISSFKNRFPTMTITEELVELAVKIDQANYRSSGAQETWLIRTATDFLRQLIKQGYSREEIIGKVSGEIYRKMKNEYVEDKLNTIENFATAIYDVLYVKGWRGQIPISDDQKKWIYEFAFVYKKRSTELANQRQAAAKAKASLDPSV